MDNTRPSPVVAPHLHSQSHSSESGMSTPAKRKFDAPHPPSADENVALTQNPATKEKLDAHLRELLSLLIKYDDDVDVLKTPLPAGNEPNSKRPRLGHGLPDGQDQLTIESKVLSGRYDSFQSFVTDLDAASTAVTDNRRAQEHAGTTSQPGRPSLQDVINRTRILRKHVDNYMLRNPFRDDNVVTSTTAPAAGTTTGAASPATSATATPVPNGATASGSETQPLEEVHAREDKIILTVFGNAPRGKQLFSSLRKSDAGKQVGKIKEEDLPPGITVSKVIPFNPDLDRSETSKKRTFAEVFTPKVTLPPLDPPSYPPARPSAVPWIDPYEAAVNARIRPEERTGFLYYPVPSGRWLQYGYEDVVRNTLNKTQTQLSPAQAATRGSRLRRGPFARHLREEDPLFANAYSSFAPSYESAGALVGREVRERMWWETAGVRKMVEALQLGQDDEIEGEKTDKKENKGVGLEMIDEALLQEAIDTYEEPKLPEEKVKNAEEKELDEILESVSDLIQTLHSYRQLRNLTPPRPAAAGGQTPASISSTPHLSSSVVAATPSPEELMTYETLKSSLAAMVATLPPYVLSKFNSDQLAELNISKSILIEGPDYPGTMEDDEYTLQQRQYSRIPQQAPQLATSAPIPPAFGRGPPRTTMAYQAATQPVAAPVAPITYQRPYTSSSRMMKSMPPSNAAAAVQFQSVATPQGYSTVRPHSQRSTHGHTQSPYAPTAAAAPVYTAQSSAYQRGPAAAGVPVAPINGTVPYAATQRVLSPANTLPSQGQPSTAAYHTQPSPIVSYQSNVAAQVAVASTTPVPGGPGAVAVTTPYVASPSRPQIPSIPATTPGAAPANVQPRYYPHQAQKQVPRASSSLAQGYSQPLMSGSPVSAVPSQNMQYSTRPAVMPQVPQVNGRPAPGAGGGR